MYPQLNRAFIRLTDRKKICGYDFGARTHILAVLHPTIEQFVGEIREGIGGDRYMICKSEDGDPRNNECCVSYSDSAV